MVQRWKYRRKDFDYWIQNVWLTVGKVPEICMRKRQKYGIDGTGGWFNQNVAKTTKKAILCFTLPLEIDLRQFSYYGLCATH